MKNEWDNPTLVKEYADKLQNQRDWYEYEVNMPSLLSLIPRKTKSILDFGSGPGQFTAILGKSYKIEGADRSPAMIALASKAYPDIAFHQWDGQSPFPGNQKFDAIFSKLTIHFLQDLYKFAGLSHQILNRHGNVVLSVQHPLRVTAKVGGNYRATRTYEGGSSKYGLRYHMIHRSFEEYIRPFLEHSFVLTGIVEPQPSKKLAQEHKLSEEDLCLPKRLNLRFERT